MSKKLKFVEIIIFAISALVTAAKGIVKFIVYLDQLLKPKEKSLA